MKKLVIIPGGFHPFHPGHLSLYNSAREKWPTADIFLAATADTSERPFPFQLKKALAKAAGVPANRFIQVKSPFSAEEITQMYDPNETILIFARSEKDRNSQPRPAERDPKTGQLPLVTRGPRKGQPVSDRLQYYRRAGLEPMSRHSYIDYLPVQQFGSGMTSGTELRAKWPTWGDAEKDSLLKSMYPAVAGNQAAVDKLRQMIDAVLKPKAVKEAKVWMHPELGIQVLPDGGLGSYRPEHLERAVLEHMKQVLEKMRDGNWEAAEYLLYRWRVLEAKVKAMKEYMAWTVKNRGKGIRPGDTEDISGLSEDYIDERAKEANGQQEVVPEFLPFNPQAERTLRRALSQYPQAKDRFTAMLSWLQSALKHSEENDQRHQKELDDLRGRLDKLEKQPPLKN
jgi:hypothetical protein